MVSQKTLSSLSFSDISDYQDYIIGSIRNGQYGQAKQLIKDMSKRQKKDCLVLLLGQNIWPLSPEEICVGLLIESL